MKWLLVLMLVGCASKSITQEVKIPVYVACVKDKPKRPTYETEKLTAASSDGEKILALARDKPKHLKYEGQLEALIAGVSFGASTKDVVTDNFRLI